jgi:murein DD-endopeptidase MepM/ murein hydrolase activator NlpD
VLGLLAWSAVAPTVSVHAVARAIRPGELVRLTVTTSEPARAIRAKAFGRAINTCQVDPLTWGVLVGIDLDVAAGAYVIDVESDTGPGGSTERAVHELEVQAHEFPTRRLRVAPGYVDPPAAVVGRILAEDARLDALWLASTPDRLWTGTFVPPVDGSPSSTFGARTILNGERRSPHAGVDFASRPGTPVRAPNRGRVVVAGDLYFTGKTVVLDHGLGLYSLLAHLSAIHVAAGDLVEPAQIVGLSGATGRVTAPHVHWSVRAGGARVDPTSLLAVLGADGS